MPIRFLLLLSFLCMANGFILTNQQHPTSQFTQSLLASSISSPSSSSAPSNASSSSITPNQQQIMKTKHSSNRRRNNKNDIEYEISRLGRRGKTDMALELFHSIESPSLRITNTAIDACARAQPVRIDAAYDIYQNMKIRPNVYTFGSLLNAIRRLGDLDAALQLLSDMQELHDITPNAVIYQSIIATAATAVRPDVAVEFLRHNVTVIGYNAALSACAKAKEYELALEVFHNMTIPKDAITYGTVMAACEAAEQWELVLQLAEEFDDIDCLGLTSALHACQQLTNGHRALEILARMKQLQDERNTGSVSSSYKRNDRRTLKGPDRVAYRLAISACGRAGMWSDGISLLKEYNELFGPDALAYTAAMMGLEYAGEYEVSFRLLSRMRQADIVPTISTFVAIIGACANACGANPEDYAPKEKAIKLLSVMRNDRSVVQPTLPVYNAVIRVCAESLDMSTAFRVFELLRTDGLSPSIVTFGTLMTACERSSSMEGMKRVFQLMREFSIRPNEIVYGAAISCCRKNGASKHANSLYENMQEEGLTPNTVTVNTVLAALVSSGSRTDMDTAIRIYESMANANRQTYSILIRALAAVKRGTDADELLSRMRTIMVPDVDLYTLTVTAYERSGQPLKALRLMESMREEGYDFYEAGVLNTAFKSAVKLASALGQRLSDSDRRLASKKGMKETTSSVHRGGED